MLAPGDKVPEFTLPLSFANGRYDDVAFSSLLGRGPLVLSFFPLAFTKTCTTQMCEARDRTSDYAAMGATVVGFSCDSKWTNQRFAAELALPHGIFSDPNRTVVDALWMTRTVAGVERVPARGFLVVDEAGNVVEAHVQEPGTPWVGHDVVAAAIAKAGATP